MNIGVHEGFDLAFSGWICAQEWDYWSYGNSALVFQENCMFSRVAAPTDIPTNILGGLPFPHTLSSISILT